jgi:hypothetical protein
MILYNWQKIFLATQGDLVDIVRVLRMITEGRVPENKYDKLFFYSQVDFKGDSFLVHPERLLYNSYLHSYKEIGVYVAVAALRPLADYHAYGKISLDMLHLPDDIQKHIENNSLLSVENGEVHFLYEGSPSKEEIH